MLGIILGFIVGVRYAKKSDIGERKVLRLVISIAIFMLWVASVASDLYRGENNTSIFLYIFMGSVIGSVNREFGEWILKLWNRK